ncbi:hypothetical protein DPMN_006216 [Dreissena polymorpha]|uniref:Uncharacterized protein n=1 Tax=Dreissena polymorpha TaxID=45954 RepID=A0A9D4MW31_DREPO|nr:hypothetical protein DPMN_006216 [Dreissena polymorpha]
MVSTITCPITVAVVTFLVVLFNTCRSETSFSEDGDNKLTTNHQVEDNDTSEIQDKLKRESWAKFASWGKRGFNGKGFVAWGKRDSSYSDSDSLEEFPEKREDWSKLATWGKRSDSLSRQKREWKGFPSWGKRENLDTINGPLDDELKEEADKRKWNPIATWGKRMK